MDGTGKRVTVAGVAVSEQVCVTVKKVPFFDSGEIKSEEKTGHIDVHLWLDGLYHTGLMAKHQRIRHNHQGIEEVRKRWGDEAGKEWDQTLISD